ncbi:heavy metal transport/detoxification protein [Leptolyngbya sp. ST-U4]|uniref:heavy metal transport/detoxification protein n=1 Tax=Leptolyngbya sp. ST-U4 TaxID=2933912 RepID=UPI001985797F|nr:heavy metal transport/detoxification protein [Cyanobacteria bacterium FACHB-502]
MNLQFSVPSLDSSDAARDLKETILTSEPDAKVDVNLEQKIVTIETGASEETIKQVITAAGHQIG